MTGQPVTQLSLQIRPDVARALHGLEPPSAASRSLAALATELGATLEPVHPGTRSAPLLTYFTLHAPNAQQLAVALRRHEAVEGAWITPPASPPGSSPA
jgi:hypothetical protein